MKKTHKQRQIKNGKKRIESIPNICETVLPQDRLLENGRKQKIYKNSSC